MQSIVFKSVQKYVGLAVCLLGFLVSGTTYGREPLSKPWVNFEFNANIAPSNTQTVTLTNVAGIRLSSEQQAVHLQPPNELQYKFKEDFPRDGGTITFWIFIDKLESKGTMNALTGDRRVSLVSLSKDGRVVAGLSIPDYGSNIVLRLNGLERAVIYSPVPDWKPREWHHIAWTWSRKNDCQKLYLDGEIRHKTAQDRMFDEIWSGEATELTLGSKFENGRFVDYLEGAISQVRIYDTTLAEEEIGLLVTSKPIIREKPIEPRILGKQTVRALTSDEPIQIDGNLRESIWKKVPNLKEFRIHDEQAGLLSGTVGWMAADEEHVYLAMRVKEEDGEVFRAKKRERTDVENIFTDSSIEWFICPRGSEKEVYQFVVNPKGVCEEVLSGSSSFVTDWQAAVQQTKTEMTIEIAVPLKSLHLERGANRVWTTNINRTIYFADGLKKLVTWTTIDEGGFYQPEKFGLLDMPIIDNKLLANFREIPARQQPVFVNKEGLSVWSESSLHRPERTDHVENVPVSGDASLQIGLAGNEYEAFHFVVRSQKMIKNVRIEISDLSLKSGQILPVSEITCNQLVYVNDEFADVLVPPESFYIPAGQACGFRVTVHSPKDTPAGIYNGWVTLFGENKSLVRMPLTVRVYGFNIPFESTVGTMYFSYVPTQTPWDSTFGKGTRMPDRSNPYYFTSEYETYMTGVYENFARHRISGHEVMPYYLDYYVKGLGWDPTGPEITAKFEKWAKFWRERGLLVGRILTLAPQKLELLKTEQPQVARYYQYWGNLVDELNLSKYVYADAVIDEPQGSSEAKQVVELWAKIVKDAAPNLRRAIMLGGHSLDKRDLDNVYDYIGLCDIWGLSRTSFSNKAYAGFFANRQKAGDKLYWYIHSDCELAVTPVITRTFFWDMWRYKIDGCLYYCVNYFWSTTENQNDRVFYTNSGKSGYSLGNGTVIWPGKYGVYNSLRWENIRDGLEDLEVMRMLEKVEVQTGRKVPALQKIGDVLSSGNPQTLLSARQNLYETAEKLLAQKN